MAAAGGSNAHGYSYPEEEAMLTSPSLDDCSFSERTTVQEGNCGYCIVGVSS